MVRNPSDVECRVRVAEHVRDKQQQGHGARAQGGRDNVLRHRGERAGVEVKGDDRDQEGGDENRHGPDAEGRYESDDDEDGADEEADDSNFEMRGGPGFGATVGDPSSRQCPDEPAHHQNDAREQAGRAERHVEPPVEQGRQPECIRGQDEIEHGLRENRGAQSGDAHEVDEGAGAGVGRPP